ncbi:MAG: hypothetical protein V3S64_01075 [bacterium]
MVDAAADPVSGTFPCPVSGKISAPFSSRISGDGAIGFTGDNESGGKVPVGGISSVPIPSTEFPAVRKPSPSDSCHREVNLGGRFHFGLFIPAI